MTNKLNYFVGNWKMFGDFRSLKIIYKINSFLSNFNIPKTKVIKSNNKQNNGWTYLCNYKNNISNIKMDINLFYKFIKNKPEKYMWHSIDRRSNEFIPSFTKKIFKKVAKVYN